MASRRVGAVIAALVGLAGAAASAREIPASFAPLVRRAEPAVVGIAPARAVEASTEPDSVQDVLRSLAGSGPVAAGSLGSGFVVSPDGEIVTAQHVVSGTLRVRVRIGDQDLDARVVGTDDKTDIALLRVDPPAPLVALPLGDSATVQIGDWVLAIGNPPGVGHTATAGIVSAKGRFLGSTPSDDLMQTDAAIPLGSAGGPLIDLEGRVVGVSTALAGPEGSGASGGFAIPIDLVRWVLGQLRENGRVVRGWIGVAVQPVTSELAGSFRLSDAEGALVTDVTADAPAARADVRRGDVIVRWGEQPIHRARELPTRVAATAPGAQVAVELLRDGEPRTVELIVREQPTATKPGEAEETAPQGWGMVVRVLDRAEAKGLGLKTGSAVVVVEVEEGTPAEDAGLEVGDVILQANGQAVGSAADLRRALATNPRHALLLVRRDTARLYLELER